MFSKLLRIPFGLSLKSTNVNNFILEKNQCKFKYILIINQTIFGWESCGGEQHFTIYKQYLHTNVVVTWHGITIVQKLMQVV